MATYINGITDYIPQVQPFKPDFNFFQSALEKKQMQYQAGYDKISQVYGQLLNSELLRQPNIERRDALFNQIDSEIHRLSGVDLSLQENVDAATTLFDPLINNDYFRKDLAYTKKYNGALQRSANIRKNPDPKSDLRWWQEGETALHYQAQDFAKSSDADSLGFGAPEYVAAVNTTDMLYKFAKDNDIDPSSVAFNGGFIYKYKNGAQAIPVLQSVFSSVLGNDPRVREMHKVQAYLDRKNYISENAGKFNGDEYAAETEYLKTNVDRINQYFKQASEDGEVKTQKIKNTKTVIESKVAKNGINPKIDQDLVELYKSLNTDDQVQTSVNDQAKEALTNTDLLSFDDGDRENLRYRVDNAVSLLLLNKLATDTASQYAMAKADVDVEANPFSVAAANHRYKLIENEDKFQKDKYLKIMSLYTASLKNKGKLPQGTSLDPGMTNGIYIEKPGKGNVDLKDVAVQERNQRAVSAISNDGVMVTMNSAQAFLDHQNNIILRGSPADKALAEERITTVLGAYNKEMSPEFTSIKHTDDINWGQAFTSLGELVAGAAGVAISAVGEGASFGLASPVAVPAMVGSAAVLSHGAYKFSEAMLGTDEEIVNKPATVSSRGMVIKQTNGTYKLVDKTEAKTLTDPNSSDYYVNVNDRIRTAMDQYSKLDPTDPSLPTILGQIQSNGLVVDENKELINAASSLLSENNVKLSTTLAAQSGVSVDDVNNFFSTDKTRTLTETEFIAKYVSWMSQPQQQANYDNPSVDDIRDYALDLYENISENYEDLKTDPDANIGIRSMDTELAGIGGINRYFSGAAKYDFDAAYYNTPAYDMAIDFFQKDFIPNTLSVDILKQSGVKVIKGSGFDIGEEKFNEATDVDSFENAQILKAFFASSVVNKGGKTGENQKRPVGSYYLHAVAANNSDKVAMTWDISPQWIKDNAGTEKAKGITWELNEAIAEGGVDKDGNSTSQLTFIMDADKAMSSPFRQMQMSKPESLMAMTGKYSINHPAGNLDITSNATGGFSYNGVVKAVNGAGEQVEQPLYGSTDTDFNALLNAFASDNGVFNQAMRDNLEAKNNIRASSSNTVYNLQPAQ